MESLRAILSHNMKFLRGKIGISQEELAYRCELHRTYISSVEREKRNISIDNIEKIAAALGVTAAELLNADLSVL